MPVIETKDGSNTLYVQEIDECYHSTFGAIQESEHIFIGSGLNFCTKNNISVLEIGFGTGLNAFLTMIETEKSNKIIDYQTIELYPITTSQAKELNYCDFLGNKALFAELHSCEWNKRLKINDCFYFTKIKSDFSVIEKIPNFDVCFFDAFSPEKQYEMWTENRFELLFEHADNGAVLTTYCAKGQVRRNMQQAGFIVERLSGPVGGKREILRATKTLNRHKNQDNMSCV
ncbi:MAG: tRNA (5-methylaminomethyl-2-thiouridine)(34)-methyltransferase MnmD [Prevotellaceae bacterium]|jgi:tRNA U34 5-methylaminomethyl-2-thiouridine-forming methyltransferase MnmC|nr:tRNA (5-methylaminomethyl-2-thiouridine)(34)-methyltransferase MnmD [Prevotellaceae bacterium]